MVVKEVVGRQDDVFSLPAASGGRPARRVFLGLAGLHAFLPGQRRQAGEEAYPGAGLGGGDHAQALLAAFLPAALASAACAASTKGFTTKLLDLTAQGGIEPPTLD